MRLSWANQEMKASPVECHLQIPLRGLSSRRIFSDSATGEFASGKYRMDFESLMRLPQRLQSTCMSPITVAIGSSLSFLSLAISAALCPTEASHIDQCQLDVR